MKEYTVYFEIYGKKMKTTIFAENESNAKQVIARKIIFHKIEEVKPKVSGDAFQFLNDIVSGKIK